MEGIFEALLQLFVELVLEIIGEVGGGIFEYIISGDFLTFSNRNLPESVSNEIITLDIQTHKKENLS